MATSRLTEQRRQVERAWKDRFDDGGHPDDVRPEIRTSWDRSAAATSVELAAAPVDEANRPGRAVAGQSAAPGDRGRRGRDPGAGRGSRVRRCRHGRRRPASSGPQAVDTCGGAPSGSTSRRAAGGMSPASAPTRWRWRSTRIGRRRCSAPSTTPRWSTAGAASPRRCATRSPGVPLGVLDLSSTWERAHPMALATVRALALAAQAVLDAQVPAHPHGLADPTIVVRVLGGREIIPRGHDRAARAAAGGDRRAACTGTETGSPLSSSMTRCTARSRCRSPRPRLRSRTCVPCLVAASPSADTGSTTASPST